MAGMGRVTPPQSAPGGGYLDNYGSWHYSYEAAENANAQFANEQDASAEALKQNKLATENAKLANESARIDNAAKRAAIQNQAAASQMTNSFLAKWGEMNQKTLDVLTNTLSGTLTGNTPATGIYADLINSIKTQVSDFDTNYGDMTKRAYDSTMRDIETRQGLTTDLLQMSNPDYEGAAGRAAADVSAQSAIARQGMATDAMSYGIDPTSGKFGALTKKSYLAESRDKVKAMTEARRLEKDKSIELKSQILSQIDPSVSGNIASNLMTQKGNLLGLQTNVVQALTAAEKAKADTALGVANTMKDIGEQYGSLGSTMLGLQTSGAGGGAVTGSGSGGGSYSTTTGVGARITGKVLKKPVNVRQNLIAG